MVLLTVSRIKYNKFEMSSPAWHAGRLISPQSESGILCNHHPRLNGLSCPPVGLWSSLAFSGAQRGPPIISAPTTTLQQFVHARPCRHLFWTHSPGCPFSVARISKCHSCSNTSPCSRSRATRALSFPSRDAGARPSIRRARGSSRLFVQRRLVDLLFCCVH